MINGVLHCLIDRRRGSYDFAATLQGEERKTAETIVRQSLGTSISLVMGLAAALAFAAALCAALTMRPPEKQTQTAAKPAGV